MALVASARWSARAISASASRPRWQRLKTWRLRTTKRLRGSRSRSSRDSAWGQQGEGRLVLAELLQGLGLAQQQGGGLAPAVDLERLQHAQMGTWGATVLD